MARKTRKHTALMLPNRRVVMRLGHILLMAMLLLVFVLGRSGHPMITSVRMQIADTIMPVLGTLSAPFEAIRNIRTHVYQWSFTYQENNRLKQENGALLRWQAEAKHLHAENARLRALLHVVPPENIRFITALIFSEHSSAFSSSALVHVGTDNGVSNNQAVISERGLVGRVVAAGKHSAQILLLTDMHSRLPVMNERTREKMILAGKNAAYPVLTYVESNSTHKKGDRIITSGDGGVFPKNIPVGVIREIEPAKISVTLFANIADIEYVSIMDNAE